MKKIKLTKGKYVIVDDEDFDYLDQWRWKYHKDNYAVRTTYRGALYMHRVINKTPKLLLTDHINRNGLDNRKSNLRSVNYKQNAFNTGLPKNNTSGVRGVVWDKNNCKWQAQIMVDQRNKFLGRFKKLEDAIQARKRAEVIYAV